jgi:hypothetical protein
MKTKWMGNVARLSFVLLLAGCAPGACSDTAGQLHDQIFGKTPDPTKPDAPQPKAPVPTPVTTTAPPVNQPPPPPADEPPPPPAEPPKNIVPGGDFSFTPVGQLFPSTAGQGYTETNIWAPAIRYPLQCGPSYPNSQVYNPGGQMPGGFCDAANYQYPWHDNFCEKRSSKLQTSHLCPAYSRIHQGQDIRANTTCTNKDITWRKGPDGLYKTDYPVVAVDDGVISYIGSFSVYLDVLKDGEPERKYTYLHLEMDKVHTLIKKGDHVTKGQVIGYLSNQFHLGDNGKPVPNETTPHLHFEVVTSVTLPDGTSATTWVSPYLSLVTAYQALIAEGNPDGCPP